MPNLDVWNALFNTLEIKDVVRHTLPIGMPLIDGKLIKSNTGEVYLFANGLKYHIQNEETMKACNFNWSKVISPYPNIEKIRS